MTGDETIKPTTTPFDEVDKTAQCRLMTRAITLKERLAEATGKLITNEDDKPKTDKHQQCLTPRTILEKYVDKQRKKWQPRCGACDKDEKLIKPHTIATIQEQE